MPGTVNQRDLPQILDQSLLLHDGIAPLWDGFPSIHSRRAIASLGFCSIVRHHTNSQLVLAQQGLDLSATTLVRPAFEALVRAVWCAAGADEAWIERFLSPPQDSLQIGETAMSPSVQRMLDQLRPHHPARIHDELARLRTLTWLAMHSYVHGGIHAFIHSLSGPHEHECAGVVINANGMLITATHLARMNAGLTSAQIPLLQRRYASCLPPSS